MAESKKVSVIQKQKPMVQVVYALAPLAAASVYFFGWRALAVLAVVNAAGFLAEYIFTRVTGKQVSQAVFVTNFIFALSLPPTIPFWIAVVGVVFGVVFGKMAFGGFGRNIFNPAMSGRAFIYVSFGRQLTGPQAWTGPVGGALGGFGAWQADAVSGATSLVRLADGETVSRLSMFLGNISGSLGETSALLILLGGLYLLVKKTASYHIVGGVFLGFAIFQTAFWLTGVTGVPDPLSAALAGSFLFGMMFIATDPVSASQTTDIGRFVYGLIIGVVTSLIRTFSIWPAGFTFAIIFANMFAPLLNHLIVEGKKARKAKAASGAGKPEVSE